LRGPFSFSASREFELSRPQGDRSTKRLRVPSSVLDAAGAPKGSKQAWGCFDQSLRARQFLRKKAVTCEWLAFSFRACVGKYRSEKARIPLCYPVSRSRTSGCS